MGVSRIILLVVALLAGGLAAFLAMRGTAPQQVVVEGPTQVIEEKKAKVLVAKAPIGVGQRITAETIEWQDWPEFAVRPEYISEAVLPDAPTKLLDAVARFEFFPGEPIIDKKLVHSDQGYLSAVLTKGMRGVSVPVSADAAAGGFVLPNDRVDIVLSRGGISQTILSNVKVLAIGTRLGEAGTTGEKANPEDPKADVFQGGTIATLELTPAQGEVIINASKIGVLSVALRSIADFKPSSDDDLQGSRAVRMIRFGVGSDVMPGSNPNVAQASFDDTSSEEQVQ
ncbi:MAG: Flp pilus assembly protein CpaB [Hyphomicrobiales bacterium]|nr:MAG: Flp pilus assembly protein CpaB [Hyphomicrobiales bacterium]